jgi:hypothetical protein
VQNLIAEPSSKYYIDPSQIELYNRAQNRLKTYVSQLLSTTVTRNVTEDFKSSLTTVIAARLNINGSSPIVDEIINDLIVKNTPAIRNEPKSSINEEFYSDFFASNYTAIITARPLEIEADSNAGKISIRKALFQDFLQSLSDPERDFKKYRFNFPLETYANLFWKGLRKMLVKYLIENSNDTNVYQKLHSKFTIDTSTFNQIIADREYKINHLEEIVDEVLKYLNSNKDILVFISDAPIFSIPLVIINPSEARNSRLYALLDSGNDEISVYKYSTEDVLIWRMFVWDKLKAKQYSGRNIEYASILN